MWPIIKKEVRENSLYLLAAFAIILFFLDNAAFKSGWVLLGIQWLLAGPSAAEYLTRAPGSGSATWNIVEVWGVICGFLSALIALAQVFPERWRRSWPLLAHLPIPRTRIVLAKLLAGLLMYAIVLLPQALFIVARLYTPGVWPGPVYSYMFLPLAGSFIAGAALYVTAFFCALRPARWYATKWLPLCAALPAGMACAGVNGALNVPGGFSGHNGVLSFAPLTAAALCLLLALWAIREQARTLES